MLTMNVFGVGAALNGKAVQIGRAIIPPNNLMTPDEALNLAAWLVAIAEHQAAHRFAEVLEAVQNT